MSNFLKDIIKETGNEYASLASDGVIGGDVDSFIEKAPLVLTKEVKKIDTKGLEKKTKAELEKLGRKIGVELDKRFTKAKLIAEIKKQNKKL